MGCGASTSCSKFDGGQAQTDTNEVSGPSLLQSLSSAHQGSQSRSLKGPANSKADEPQMAWTESGQVAPAAQQEGLAQPTGPSRSWLRKNLRMRHGRV
mmetsp:Transcript_101338/g.241691  ORF Transcript_101338/g.241691 Transcript_101338/m.241691 type:complete len:98 (+) Transcript_101338:46-339(+)|eukprot:CAMPEP_0181541864 /NCGR_PEP_ID=MMETSP1110-20121109/77619_1 /TAXON_ID=174948 /ORGANISM="Symbiodinium sp., Strain CCMP421" /LENGTH=97 /DNA_ID=CAMNT_0023673545 /DNA_START=32 /DNA_END=325 /DNA_ORIENTATION=-